MDDRYPITPAEGNPHSVHIWFKGTAITGIYDYDPVHKKVRRRGLSTTSLALQREGRLAEEVGRNRLINAQTRAENYFAAMHQHA